MAIKNKITDLNNHLFAELERLSDEELKGDELKAEIAEKENEIQKLKDKGIDVLVLPA